MITSPEVALTFAPSRSGAGSPIVQRTSDGPDRKRWCHRWAREGILRSHYDDVRDAGVLLLTISRL